MGDHRASVKIEFEMHGHSAKCDLWVNWFDNGCGIDQRIVDWFGEQSGIAIEKYRDELEAFYASREKATTEEAEKAELARLKAKYESK
jgi:hypothetical protein